MNSCILSIVHINDNYSTTLFFKLSNSSFKKQKIKTTITYIWEV